MTDQEILTAMKGMLTEERELTDAKIDAAQRNTDAKIESLRQSTDAKIDTAQKETIQQIKVLLENGVEKQIRLLAEGHAQILARLPEAEEQGKLKGRVTTLEHIASEHTKQINELRRAQ